MNIDDRDWKRLKYRGDDETVYWGESSFECPHDMRYDDIIGILEDWENGRVERNEVQKFSSLLADIGGGWPRYRVRFVPSVWFEIMSLLEVLEAGPLLREDASRFQEILRRSHESPIEACRELEAYMEAIDWDARADLHDGE